MTSPNLLRSVQDLMQIADFETTFDLLHNFLSKKTNDDSEDEFLKLFAYTLNRILEKEDDYGKVACYLERSLMVINTNVDLLNEVAGQLFRLVVISVVYCLP